MTDNPSATDLERGAPENSFSDDGLQNQALQGSDQPQTQSAEGDIDIDIRALFLMLWRRKYVLIGIVVLGLTLSSVIVNLIEPRYSAKTLFLLDDPSATQGLGPELQGLMTAFSADSTMILSQLEVVRSRSMARRVVERLDLVNDPEFNPRLYELRRMMAKRDDDVNAPAFKQLKIFEDEMMSASGKVQENLIDATVSNFLEHLRARSLPGSNVLQVEFTSTNPRKAALIVNTIADVYIEQRLEAKFATTKKLTDWLDGRLSDLRKQVRDSANAVQEYKVRYNIIEGTRSAVSAEQLSQLNSQLVLAKAKRAEAEARLQQVRDIVDDPDSLEAAAEIVNSPLIQRLKIEQSSVQRELSDLSSRYGPRHPEIKKRKAELADLKVKLKEEMDKIARSLENELYVANARLEALDASLSEIEGVRLDEDEAGIRLQELQREAESNRLIYDTFLNTYKRSDQKEELQEAEAEVISYAVVPELPAYPNKLLFMSLSAAVSLFLGLAIVLLLEKLDNTFRSATQLEAHVGLPCFALIPEIEQKTQTEVANYVLSKPASTVAEAVRTLRMVINLRASRGGKKPKVITVTSSFPGEGKTTLSTWLSRLAAKSGEKVVVIDCDLRRPNIHRTLGKQNDVSLVEYLTGKKALEEVVQRDDPSGVHVIYGRSVPNSALDLVSSPRMEKLIKALGESYDLVILDSPASLAVSDARILAKYSDHTVYVVGWNRTPREVVIGGVKQFTDMNYKAMSLVLSGVDVKRHIKYGYGDTVYYYGRYTEYYSN